MHACTPSWHTQDALSQALNMRARTSDMWAILRVLARGPQTHIQGLWDVLKFNCRPAVHYGNLPAQFQPCHILEVGWARTVPVQEQHTVQVKQY